MKHNLKTFPYAQTAEQMERWIRDFEEEMQQLKCERPYHPESVCGMKEKLIDEVLGVEKCQEETEYALIEVPKDLKEALDKSVISAIDALWDVLEKEGETT